MSIAAAALLMILGSLFCFFAALGILRFPDLCTRLHAAAKAGPLGAGLILLSVGVASGDPSTIVRGLLGLVFFMLFGPVSAHLLARATWRRGGAPTSIVSITEVEHSR